MQQSNVWTLGEKNKLCHLLYSYPHNAYDNLAKQIKTKTADDVKKFVEKLVANATSLDKYKSVRDTVHRAPLEEWKEVAADMTSFEKTDCSANLSKVFSIISCFEDLPSDEDEPNYKAIYRYLSQCLQQDMKEDIETLGPLESAVVLDLLHSLMNVLSEHDTDVQRNIIKWKYMLLDYRDPDNGQLYEKLTRKASENDFKEFIEDLYGQTSDSKGSKANNLPGLLNTQIGCADTVKCLVHNAAGYTPTTLTTTPTLPVTSSATAPKPSRVPPTPSATVSKRPTILSQTQATMHEAPASQKIPAEVAVIPEVSVQTQAVSTPTMSPNNDTCVISTPMSTAKPFTQPVPGQSIELASSSISCPIPEVMESAGPVLLPTTSQSQNVMRQTSAPAELTSVTDTVSQPSSLNPHTAEACRDSFVDQSTPTSRITQKSASTSDVPRHKRGRKGFRDVPETPITEIVLVMPPEGKEIVNYSSRGKKPWKRGHLEGKYESIDPEAEIITNDLQRDYFYEVHRSESEQFYKKPKPKRNILKPPMAIQKIQKTLEETHKRKYEALMNSVKDPEAPVKKPKLYTINPFCLPVSLIDLDHTPDSKP